MPENSPAPSHAWNSGSLDNASGLTKVDAHASSLSSESGGQGGVHSSIMTVEEAESVIERLCSTPVTEIGSSSFLRRHADFERLNLQAHQQAQQKTDEFVLVRRGREGVSLRSFVVVSAFSIIYKFIWWLPPSLILGCCRRCCLCCCHCRQQLLSIVVRGSRLSFLAVYSIVLQEAFLTFDKVRVIIEDLLAIEAWRTEVLPLLVSDLASNSNVMRVYFTLYHEATLVNLLEVMLFHKHVLEGLGELTVDLVDYCARRMSVLAVPLSHNKVVQRAKAVQTAAEISEHIDKRTGVQEIQDHVEDMEFKVSVAAVTLARYLCEHFEALPLSSQTRILDTHDFMVLLVPLVEEPPWTRRNGASWEKLADAGRWTKVERGDLLKVTKCEAQVWLTVYHLTCSQTCRESYSLNAFRKEQTLRLRKYLNDVVLDQVPVLADAMRYMDELALMNVPENSSGHGSALMMQQVAAVRDNIVRGKNWENVAKDQFEAIWSKVSDAKDEDLRKISDIYNEEGIEDILGEAKPFEITSQPIQSVVFDVEGVGKKAFRIKQGQEAVLVDTAHGNFNRFKLIPTKMEADDDDGIEILGLDDAGVLPHDCKITATVTFAGEIPHVAELTLEDAELAVGEKKDVPAKCWKQVGSLAEKLVCQLGFERHVNEGPEGPSGNKTYGYKISDTVFVSQPLWEPQDSSAFL